MRRWVIDINEVHVQRVAVVAENAEEAKKKALDADCICIDNTLEYSHMLETNSIHAAREANDGDVENYGAHYWENQE